MDGPLIGFLRRDELGVQQAPQGVVQALHAEQGAAFEHASDLVRFAFADEVGDGGVIDQHLARDDLPAAIRPAHELL